MSETDEIKQLIELLDELPHPVGEVFNINYTPCVWSRSGKERNCEISWNEEDNVDDLAQGHGVTYFGEIKWIAEYEGYVIVDLDSGCGYNYVNIFDANKEIKE